MSNTTLQVINKPSKIYTVGSKFILQGETTVDIYVLVSAWNSKFNLVNFRTGNRWTSDKGIDDLRYEMEHNEFEYIEDVEVLAYKGGK